MLTDDIPAVFVTHAAAILADTSRGLTGSEIVRQCAALSIDANVTIPYDSYPFAGRMGTTKRTALFENLMAFPAKWRYKLIRELCDHKMIQHSNANEANKLKAQLIVRYGQLDDGSSTSDLNHAVIEETRHWLGTVPKALDLYNSALQKSEHGIFDRNVLDDLRLALEILLHTLLENHKSLENQIQPLGAFIKEREGSPELTNMFLKLIEYYSKYQNTYVKHDSAVAEHEVNFVFEITSCFMRHLIRIYGQDGS